MGLRRATAGASLAVREVATLQAVRRDWERLEVPDGNVFRSYAWAEAIEREAGADGRRLLAFIRADGVAVGIANLRLQRASPIRVYGFEGQAAADEIGPVCDPVDRPAVAAALRRAIVSGAGVRPAVLLARGLPREEGWTALLGGLVTGGMPSLALRLEGDWEQWLASRTSNFRQQVRGRERKLERDHGLAYHRVTDAAEVDATLEAMVALHDAQWQGESRFFEPPGREVQVAFARVARERGWLRLWRADLDDAPAAYYLGYAYGGEHWYFQMARDPAREEQRIGFVLLAHAVREAFGEGARRFRLLSGAFAYKERFANDDVGNDTVVVARRPLARSIQLGLVGARRLPESMHDVLSHRLHL